MHSTHLRALHFKVWIVIHWNVHFVFRVLKEKQEKYDFRYNWGQQIRDGVQRAPMSPNDPRTCSIVLRRSCPKPDGRIWWSRGQLAACWWFLVVFDGSGLSEDGPVRAADLRAAPPAAVLRQPARKELRHLWRARALQQQEDAFASQAPPPRGQ